MKVPHVLLAVSGAMVVSGCGSLSYNLKYPEESFTVGGKSLTLHTQRCRVNRQDCIVDLDPTPDPMSNWGPEVVVAEGGGVQRIHWRIRNTDEWSFADPGVVFKTEAGAQNFRCVNTRFVIQCANRGTRGDFEYSIRVLKDGQGQPIEKDPWFINR